MLNATFKELELLRIAPRKVRGKGFINRMLRLTVLVESEMVPGM